MRLGVGAALVDGSLVPGDVEVADGRIAGVGLSSANGSGVAAPGFVDLQNRYGDAGFQVIGLSVDDPVEKLRPSMAALKINYPVVRVRSSARRATSRTPRSSVPWGRCRTTANSWPYWALSRSLW